jgi:hypothetical protein
MSMHPLILFALVALASVNILSAQPAPAGLTGYVELHAHPLANVGFGGKLVYGGPDIGSLLPSDPDCMRRARALSMPQALGHDRSTHAGWDPFNNPCGDSIREQVIHVVQMANNAANELADATGFPDFKEWPVWNDLTHQKMWVDWIKRAHDDGLNVMVALAVNNKTLADAVCGPCDGPTDDKGSADLQIAEIKAFVGRHADFMEIAFTADDLARINKEKPTKLAVVLGVEVDNFGNFNTLPTPPSDAQIKAEIDRLFAEGVRYIFPVHLLDNRFGGTATYEDLFNFSTQREDGNYWKMACECRAGDPSGCPPPSQMEEGNFHFSPFAPFVVNLLNVVTRVKLKTTFPPLPAYPVCGVQLSADKPSFTVAAAPGLPGKMSDALTFQVFNAGISLDPADTLTATVQLRDGSTLSPIAIKKTGDPLSPTWDKNPSTIGPFSLTTPIDVSTIAKITITLGTSKANSCPTLLNAGVATMGIVNPPTCLILQELSVLASTANPTGGFQGTIARAAFGQVNTAGLNDQGKALLKEIMRHGMLIDIDHMSDKSKQDAIDAAKKVPNSYPLNSGHSGLRGFFPAGYARAPNDINERSTSLAQYQEIARLHGMAGLGTGKSDAWQLVEMYKKVLDVMQPLQPGVSLGIGTDTDGFAPGMPPRCNPPIDVNDPKDFCLSPTENPSDHSTKRSISMVAYTDSFLISKVGDFPVHFDNDGNKTIGWDYNRVGVAHYGMLPDFRMDMATAPSGPTVVTNMNQGAEYFYETWKICEDRKNNVQ